MKNNHRKKRGLWIDLSLLGSILGLGIVIVFLTIFNTDFKFQKTEASDEGLNSDLKEEDSAFPGVKIATDISNDGIMPFAIQYPLTNSKAFNEAILQYIETSKNSYINTMRIQKNAHGKDSIPGELNISLNTYQYGNDYYSFVLTNNTSVPGKITETTVETFVFNQNTNTLLNFRALLNEDIKNLNTFANYVRSELKKDKELAGLLIDEAVDLATAPKWINFQQFSLTDDSIELYFNQGKIADRAVGIPTLAISMSFINPLLATDFQIEMESAETILPDTVANQGGGKRVALTFDDGPNPKTTKYILDLLKKYDAKATFFMLGSRVQYYPDLVRETFNNGHEIGNHTWSHSVLTKMNSKQILKEFDQTEQAIVNVLGENSTVFRPPYGATNERVKGLIPRLSVNWTIDTLDWKHRDANKLLPAIKSHMHNNAIILMHDIHQSTADGLEPVLAYLQKEGYEFVTVTEILDYQ